MKTFTKEWLVAANDDLLTVNAIISNDLLTHIVAFHAQQCIEKCFKAILEDNEIDLPKIHKLIKLKNILPIQLSISNDDILNTLDGLYIDSRYPGAMGLLPNGKPTLEEAREFYEFAQSIFNQVCKVLNINPAYKVN